MPIIAPSDHPSYDVLSNVKQTDSFTIPCTQRGSTAFILTSGSQQEKQDLIAKAYIQLQSGPDTMVLPYSSAMRHLTWRLFGNSRYCIRISTWATFNFLLTVQC